MPAPESETRITVLRVFTDDHEDHGNALGVVIEDAPALDRAARQELAYELGFSETVFVDDAATGALQIFTPVEELPLAGHPLVGTAWLLAHRGTPVAALRPPAGEVACGADGESAWIEADPAAAPPFRLEQLATVDGVESLEAGDRPVDALDYAWAWIDEDAGIVRTRAFVPVLGIVEDEATGSAALRLTAALGRPLEIRQGRGSRITTAPTGNGLVRISGRVVLDEEMVAGA